MSIGIKIGIDAQQHSGSGYAPQTIAHIARVAEQGGTIDDTALLNLYVQYLVSNNLMSSQYIGAIPSVTGYKEQGTTGNVAIVFSVDPAGSTSGAYIGDMRQATLAYQPKLLKYSGEKYYWNGSDGGNNCSTPNTVANQLTDDVEIITKVNLTSLTENQFFAKQYPSVYFFFWAVGGTLSFSMQSALVTGNCDVLLSSFMSVNVDTYLKVVRKASTGEIKFYSSLDGISYTQRGSTVTSTIGSVMPNPLYPLIIGDFNDIYSLKGKMYFLTISKTIGGTPTVNFDFTNYNPAVSETTWTATTGETWTLNRPATPTDYVSNIVTRTTVISGSSQYVQSASGLSLSLPLTHFSINDWSTVLSGKSILGGSSSDYKVKFFNNSGQVSVGDNGGSADIGATPTRRALITQTKNGTASSIGQINKGTIVSGSTGILIPTQYTQDAGNVGTDNSITTNEAIIVLGAELTAPQRIAMQDFINTTLFNGEIY